MSNMTLDVSDAPAAAPAAAEGASTSSEPAAAMMGVNLDEGGRERQQSVALNDDPLVNKVTAATSFAELQAAVKPLAEWQYAAEQAAGIERAKTYVQGSDKDVLCGFFVSSINEWKIAQPRVLVITHTAYYRVTYSHKYGRIDHYHKTPLSKLRVIEKTAVGLKIYLTEQDGNASIGKKLSGWFSKSKEKDEFEHVREYLPTVPGAFPGGVELCSDVIAACLHKAAELASKLAAAEGGGSAGFAVPTLLTTEGRKQILADRKEAARLEVERVEREAAQKELSDAIAAAKAARDAAPPAPQEGGSTAMKNASALLDKPMKRAKKAVDFPEAEMAAAEALKGELDEVKKERETAERLELERVEREAAQEELREAITACESSRDPSAVVKALKRCKKAVDADAELMTQGEGLKAACDEEKAAAAKAAKEEAAAAKQADKDKAAAAKAEADAAKAAKAAEEAAAKAKAAEEAAAAKPAAEEASAEAAGSTAEPEGEAAAAPAAD